MWDLGNRAFVAIASAFSGCVFLYNVWGPILILAISLLLAVYACYSLIANDSLLSPHAFVLFDYCKHFSFELRATFEIIVDHLCRYTRQFFESAKRRFWKLYVTSNRMDKRRGSHYQLSSDSYPTSRELSNSNRRLCQQSSHLLYNNSPFIKNTSTPIYKRKEEEYENQRYDLSVSDHSLSRRMPISRRQSDAMSSHDGTIYFDSESSSLNSSAGSKVQTRVLSQRSSNATSEPLSGSSRYNIDQRIYNDVTSPGLAGRLTKYAVEASSKLAQQSQYRVGQFPKVNLYASPVPVINVKAVKTRSPATVRVAPPSPVRYSPPSKQKGFADSHPTGDKRSFPNVAQVLREISLKRHASRENVSCDIAKKQKIDGLTGKELDTPDEVKQKRSREESSKSEEDVSPQTKSIRPAKRTKTPSCYDIINSLSSSKNVVSGVKRKARDFSRSGTPDFEKHFKSLECVQNASTQTVPQVQNASPKEHRNYDTAGKRNDVSAVSSNCSYADRIQERSPLKGILKSGGRSFDEQSEGKHVLRREENRRNEEAAIALNDSAKLSQKLFMRAEPERNEKLRMLVEEQGNIQAKFTTDDVEEIKREDIADMRQTSMKARLQSMFDAISGKAASRINPDVVIQAEEVNSPPEAVPCPVSCATLNSSTVTTNVNTTPISTSAIAPSPDQHAGAISKSPKHVTFVLPRKETSPSTSSSIVDTSKVDTGSVTASATNIAPSSAPGIAFTGTPVTTARQSFAAINSSTQNSNVTDVVASATVRSVSQSQQPFTFGATVASTSEQNSSAIATPASVPTFGSVTAASSTPSVASTGYSVSTSERKSQGQQNSMVNASQGTSIPSFSSNVGSIGSGTTFPTPFGASPANATISFMSATSNAITNTSTTSNVATVNPASVSTSSSSTPNTGSVATPLFAFGNKSANPPTSTKSNSIFTFGATTGSSPQVAPTFGPSIASSAQPTSTMNNAVKSTATPVVQVNSTTTTASVFGTSATPAFKFSGAATTSASDNSKPNFSFGTISTASSTSAATPSMSAFATGQVTAGMAGTFGNASTTSTTSNAAHFAPNTNSMFAKATTAQPIFGKSSSSSGIATPPTFALLKSTAPATFASTNVAPLFSNTGNVTSTGIASTTSSMVFGSSPASTSVSGFSGTSGTNACNVFAGGSSTTTTAQASFTTTTSIFGQANSKTTANFGQANLTTVANFGGGSNIFGSNTGDPSLFGSQSNAPSAFNASKEKTSSSSGTFGSATTSASGQPTQGFSAMNSTTSFGAQPNQIFGGQSSTSQAFGSASPSMFGSGTTASLAFGASGGSSANGGSAASAPSLFSAPAPSNTFTEQKSSSASSTFGTVGNTSNAPTAFGTDASSAFKAPSTSGGTMFSTDTANKPSNNNAGGIFTFGANQKPPQQTGVYPFGSKNSASNSAGNPSSSTPFQFNAPTSTNSGTGLFSAPPVTPSINFGTTTSTSTFSAPTPHMFSIGSGTTAPRSRNAKTRKPR